jgi:hypothetical protein
MKKIEPFNTMSEGLSWALKYNIYKMSFANMITTKQGAVVGVLYEFA